MKILITICFLIGIFSHKTLSQVNNSDLNQNDSITLLKITPSKIIWLEIPQCENFEDIIYHNGYALYYNEKFEQANWVAYELTSEETNKRFERTNKFKSDPMVTSGTANDNDYLKSGYDRGHLAPASDMGWSLYSMEESFYYSNMSPQTPSFNRGIWKNLESLVRQWAIENNNIYIVTGPVLENGLPTIGYNKVAVPKYFYKVILDYSLPEIKAIGFIIPNTGSQEPLEKFAVSIDSVESRTGLNFYPNLEDTQEKIIEKTLCIQCWSWNVKKKENVKDSTHLSLSVQCEGITKKGERCKLKTLNESKLCHLHNTKIDNTQEDTKTTNTYESGNQNKSTTSVQCSGTTKSGSRCKRMTTASNGRCYQH